MVIDIGPHLTEAIKAVAESFAIAVFVWSVFRYF